MTGFSYHPDVLATFPRLVSGVIYIDGLTNAASPEELRRYFLDVQQQVRDSIGNRSLSEIPSLSAWRQAFRKFGTDPTKYRCAAEALMRRLVKKDDIPFINTMVDIGNLVSVKYAVPVCVIDTQQIEGELIVRFADGSERFTDLGQSESPHPDPGEVIYTDARKVVYARRWCWRQGVEGTMTMATRNAILTIEAQHDGGTEVIPAAQAEFVSLLQQYTGGNIRTQIITASER